ncbi:hypothetical protein FHX46_003970 [Amycolatopsis viridis]|uniref:Uncharacterized protein n=1 Tax=Amycolatopsis viridis TaxID=185678 RepID=A0ABX0T1M1_9PSEU|nr:hypothetical protein [Amycolatopsis viridis]
MRTAGRSGSSSTTLADVMMLSRLGASGKEAA